MRNVSLKRLKIIVFLLVVPFCVAAQTKSVGAIVKLPDGSFAQNVSVTIKGSIDGTTTNSSGRFIIQANPSDVLTISFSGYKDLEYKADALPATIVLEPTISELDEVVVVGYEVKKKKDLTTSVSSVDLKNNTEGGYASFQQLIGGRAAGVLVSENSTDPGEALMWRSGESAPLVLPRSPCMLLTERL